MRNHDQIKIGETSEGAPVYASKEAIDDGFGTPEDLAEAVGVGGKVTWDHPHKAPTAAH